MTVSGGEQMGLLHRAPRGRALSHRYSSSPTPYSVRPAPSIARFLGVWSVVVALLFGCFFFFVGERGWRIKRGGARANLGTRPSPGLTPAKPRGVFRSRRPAAERTHAPPPRANAQKKCSNEGQFHALQLGTSRRRKKQMFRSILASRTAGGWHRNSAADHARSGVTGTTCGLPGQQPRPGQRPRPAPAAGLAIVQRLWRNADPGDHGKHDGRDGGSLAECQRRADLPARPRL